MGLESNIDFEATLDCKYISVVRNRITLIALLVRTVIFMLNQVPQSGRRSLRPYFSASFELQFIGIVRV